MPVTILVLLWIIALENQAPIGVMLFLAAGVIACLAVDAAHITRGGRR